MKNVHKGLGVKNMSDLIFKTENLTNKQIQKYAKKKKRAKEK